jgi:hypothetical protein
LPYNLPVQIPQRFVPIKLAIGFTAKFTDHKTKKNRIFLNYVNPSSGNFTIPLATILDRFSPENTYK